MKVLLQDTHAPLHLAHDGWQTLQGCDAWPWGISQFQATHPLLHRRVSRFLQGSDAHIQSLHLFCQGLHSDSRLFMVGLDDIQTIFDANDLSPGCMLQLLHRSHHSVLQVGSPSVPCHIAEEAIKCSEPKKVQRAKLLRNWPMCSYARSLARIFPTDERTDGRKDGRTDGQTDGRTD